jgi:hypothetical protein
VCLPACVGCVFVVAITETARWSHGGAFAQSQTVQNSAPGPQGQTGGTTCTNFNGNNDCGNTTNNFGPPRVQEGIYQNGQQVGIAEAIIVSFDQNKMAHTGFRGDRRHFPLQNFPDFQNLHKINNLAASDGNGTSH